jgi:hypothetical protein
MSGKPPGHTENDTPHARAVNGIRAPTIAQLAARDGHIFSASVPKLRNALTLLAESSARHQVC